MPGGRLKLHTYHLVREDQQALYGFRSADELGFFTLLLTVNGVGPKVALAIVGSRPTADLQLAIMTQDQAVLVAIPGIGKKLAERIIFELKEKVTAAGVAAAGTVGGWRGSRAKARSSPRCRRSATRSARRARRRATALADVGVASTLEERVKAALRSLVTGLRLRPSAVTATRSGRVPISQESPAHSGVSSRVTSRPGGSAASSTPIEHPPSNEPRIARPWPRSALRSGAYWPLST